MTGYGRGQSVYRGGNFSVELNSVNRKQSDVAVNLPRELAELEPRIRDIIHGEISRGRLNVVLTYHRGEGSNAPLCLDSELAQTYFTAMRALQEKLGISGEISIDTVLRAPGVLRPPEEQLSADEVWPSVSQALNQALHDLVQMRSVEGENLSRDLANRIQSTRECVAKITAVQPGVVQRYRQSLQDRIQRAGIDIPLDDERLTKEVIFFAEKSDITEELTRLQSHFTQFLQHLKKNEPVGRTLEFMTQEIAREFNTLGAKANDIEISQLIVACKAEMEKVREQIQNIE
jgi:uncharacterized protein (TIGR00255 family)